MSIKTPGQVKTFENEVFIFGSSFAGTQVSCTSLIIKKTYGIQ